VGTSRFENRNPDQAERSQEMTEIARKPIFGKPVDGKRANGGYRCELCGTWIEYRDLGKVLAHERGRILRKSCETAIDD
jgi:hypothetical protein